MKDMSKQELLEWLDDVTNDIIRVEDEQAYKQIRKLIEDKPKVIIYEEHIREFLIDLDNLQTEDDNFGDYEFMKEWLEEHEDVKVEEK